MAGLFKRATVGLALRLGYVPIDRSWIEQLKTVHGESRRSSREYLLRLLIVALWIAPAAFFIGVVYRSYREDPSDKSIYVMLLPVAGLVALAVVLFRRAGITFKFEHGHVSSFASSGRLLWREDLTGLTDIGCANYGGDLWLTLRWRDRKRRFECYRSLAKILLQRVSAPNNALEQTRDK
jgi:hypothetical protein